MIEPTHNVARRTLPRRVLNRLEVDKAVFFAVALRAWQLVAGLATALLMTRCFTEELQGYYYTFSSLIALQMFFELGFNIVVVNICSHEWRKLRLGPAGSIEGEPAAHSRLISLGRWLVRWYSVASVLFILIVTAVGAWFIGQKHNPEIQWFVPWVVLVALSGGLLATVPFHALLEGCNQVVALSVFRLLQAIAANIAVWWVMFAGGGLWALVATTGTRLAADLLFIVVWYRHFFGSFLAPPGGEQVRWRDEIWPLQWRIGILGTVAYFAFNLFTPVMFHYQGEAIAGQMGLTLTVVTALQAAALAWVQTRTPRFGMLIASRDFRELDRIFFRLTVLASLAYIAAASLFWCALFLLAQRQFPLADRLLSPATTAIFLLGALFQLVAGCQAIYVRAHKREPFLIVGVMISLVTGLAVWLIGARYGAMGTAFSFLAVQLGLNLPAATWYLKMARREWHMTEPSSDE